MQNLVRAAHARGLRVILDFVPNHLSEQSAYFIDAQAHGRRSPYFDYFARDAGGHAVHYFDWHNLENLNYDNPEVQHLVIEASAYWVRKFDIDGFRVDAAWGPRERAPAFWPRWQAELKRIKPDLLLLAEASARDPYYSGSGFDAAYDWSDQLGEWAWRDAFETGSLERLRSAIGERSSRAPLVFRFLDNNDTGARFVTRYGVARTRVAAAMLLTLPGLPGLYSGEEVGAAFEPYADGGTIAGEDSYGLRAWYAHLLALRRTYPALRSRELHMLNVVPSNQVLAYLRPGETERDDLIVLLNYGPAPLRISLPDEVIRGAPLEGWKDLVNGECLRLQDGSLLLPPQSVRILKRG